MPIHLRSYSYVQACAFLVVRSYIQTHEQNIQLGSQTEAGKMIVLGRHELGVKDPLSVELYKQLGLHRKPHYLMLQNKCLLCYDTEWLEKQNQLWLRIRTNTQWFRYAPGHLFEP